MAKRKRQAKRSSGSAGRGGSQWLLVVGLLLLLFLADRFGLLDLEQLLGDGSGGGDDRQPVETSGPWYDVYFTRPGTDSHWPEEPIIDSVDAAQERLWIAVFDFELSDLADALVRAQDRGVDVRLVIDADNEGLPSISDLRDRGVEVRVDTRDALMHNKFIVVDRGESWAGSLNLTDNDVLRHNNNFIRLRSAEMNANFAQEFEEMWDEEFGPTSTADTPNPHLSFGESEVDVYFSPEDEPRLALLDVLNGAEREIRFMAFTFTDEAVAEALIAAERRGVDVAGVFEGFGATSSSGQYERLLNLDFAVRIDGNPGIMHHKVFVVDGERVVTGSYNSTLAASRSNDETMLILHDAGVAAAYLGEWEKIWGEAKVEP